VDYIGNIVYKNDKIDYIQTAEGRFVYETNGIVHYEFYAKDHLGNVRATYTRSPIHPHNIHVTQTTDYYPFGLPHARPNGTNKYLYNGKEIDNEMNMYDYRARFLGLDIPVWGAVDPLAEKYYSSSPYMYVRGNPILRVDFGGLSDGDYYDKNLKHIGWDGSNDGKIYVVTKRKDVKKIEEADDLGRTTPTADINSEIELPSVNMRNAMSNSIDASNNPTADDVKGGFHEEGGVSGIDGNGNEVVGNATPGAYSNPLEDEFAIINLMTSFANAGNSIVEAKDSWHVHASGTKSTYDQNNNTGSNSAIGGNHGGDFNQYPSPLDYNFASERSGLFIGNHYVLGARTGEVTIYNGTKNVVTMPLDKFLSLTPRQH